MESSVEKQAAAPSAEHLRPWRWQRGQSGNPKGRRTTPQLIAELYDILAAEFEAPTDFERMMLQEAAKLLVRAQRSQDVDIAVRAFGAVRRLLHGLRQRRIEDAPPSPRSPLPWGPVREDCGLYEPPKERR